MSNYEKIKNASMVDVHEEPKHPPEKADAFRGGVEARRRKTVEEKAREKGYYKKEDGSWWQTYDDGFDEPVEWFKLDEEYPDLADKTEELAAKYHVEYNDCFGLKENVYKNAANLEGASEEHLANIFSIAGAISFSRSGTGESLVGYDSDKLEAIYNLLNDYYSAVSDLMPEHKLDRRIMGVGECLVRNYGDNLVEGDFLGSLAKYSAGTFLNDEKSSQLLDGIKIGIEGLAKNEDSGKVFGQYMVYLDELSDDNERITKYDTKCRMFRRYVLAHGITSEKIKGFRDVVFPLVMQRDSEARPIIEGANAYGTSVGTYGIADYAEECLLSSYNPREIDKLIRIYHEIPTSDYAKFEQNRKDAARLQGTIIGGRDFIHDERPGAHEVLVAIKDYYDNRDTKDGVYYKSCLEKLEAKYHFGVLPNALDLVAYEKPVEYMSGRNYAKIGSPDETAWDILNRLVENTNPDLLEAPETRDEELNKLMKAISPVANEQTGEILVDFDKVGRAVAKMNEIVLRNKGKQGIYPSMVSAIAFLDKMSAYALRNVGKKDLRELPFDPGFKEIVRFSQLTSSMKYDENDFENKYRQITDKFSEAYGDDDVDSSKIVEGYQVLSQQILRNVQELSKNYASKSVTARFSDAVWSGNLSDELIGLFDRVV